MASVEQDARWYADRRQEHYAITLSDATPEAFGQTSIRDEFTAKELRAEIEAAYIRGREDEAEAQGTAA
jgi:hypothetical protein